MQSRRTFLKFSAAATAGAASICFKSSRVLAQIGQGIPLPGSAIPKWVDPLPIPHITAATQIELGMEEFLSPVMPSTFIPAGGIYSGTWVWGYKDQAGQMADCYIGPIVLAKRGTPTTIKYVNNLGTTATTRLAAWTASMDQTLHWADPLGTGMSFDNFVGPIPTVPHLHGGEIPPELDGGPDSWFTSDGAYIGHAYHSLDGTTAKNHAIYRYPNCQEAANIWFHDHGLGITRLNVYAGLAGGYLISDRELALPPGLTPHGLGSAPGANDEELIIPLVIQDRMFNTDGQLYFPNLGINPEHPLWIPEFLGDVIVVNGKVWPTVGTAIQPLDAKRYRFLLLNGSNARTYELFLVDPVTGQNGPPMWVIGTDGGYLDTPAKIDPNSKGAVPTKLTIMPGERYDVIVDFNDPVWRRNAKKFSGQLVLRNTGRTPYPKGVPPTGSTVGQIVKFFIGAPVADASYDPAAGVPIRTDPMIRLVDPALGTPAAGVVPQVIRQLTLNEVMGPGGPLEILVNNTKWDGTSVATDIYNAGVRGDFDQPIDSVTEYYSELPNEGETELWEIINITADAHPIHLHLVQFQLMNRQAFNVNNYVAAYGALFPLSSAIDPMTGLAYPGGVEIGGFGPPNDYALPNLDGALGGNPAISPFLQGAPIPPLNYEAGWKDTVIMYPGQVTRILVRWAPTELPAATLSSEAQFSFDPGGAHGYVWHCHIIDHEDNEMMRPVSVKSQVGATRSYNKGTDY